LFSSALRGRYAGLKPAGKKTLTASPQHSSQTEADTDHAIAEESRDPATDRAMAKFESLPILDQKRRLEQFAESLKEPLRSTYVKQGLGSAVIRRSLAGWLVKTGNG
jgi:hypothetical protein